MLLEDFCLFCVPEDEIGPMLSKIVDVTHVDGGECPKCGSDKVRVWMSDPEGYYSKRYVEDDGD